MKKQMLWGMLAGLMAAGLLLFWQKPAAKAPPAESTIPSPNEQDKNSLSQTIKRRALVPMPINRLPTPQRIQPLSIDGGH